MTDFLRKERTSSGRLGILISGRGSNLQAILEGVATKRLDASVAVVISNVRGAPGLDRAREAGVKTLVMPHADWATRGDYDRALAAELRDRGADLICLAGFMRLLSPAFIDAFPNAIVNIHPSLSALVPRARRTAASVRAWRDNHGRDRAFRHRRARRRPDRHAGVSAGRAERHSRVTRRPHPRGGAPAVPGRDRPPTERRLADRGATIRAADTRLSLTRRWKSKTQTPKVKGANFESGDGNWGLGFAN